MRVPVILYTGKFQPCIVYSLPEHDSNQKDGGVFPGRGRVGAYIFTDIDVFKTFTFQLSLYRLYRQRPSGQDTVPGITPSAPPGYVPFVFVAHRGQHIPT